MRPVTPKLSPPALPAKTIPFHARGAIGTESPLAGSPSSASHAGSPVAASRAKTCPPLPRNNLPSRYAAPRLTPTPPTGPGRLYFHFKAQVDASTAYVLSYVVK